MIYFQLKMCKKLFQVNFTKDFHFYRCWKATQYVFVVYFEAILICNARTNGQRSNRTIG